MRGRAVIKAEFFNSSDLAGGFQLPKGSESSGETEGPAVKLNVGVGLYGVDRTSGPAPVATVLLDLVAGVWGLSPADVTDDREGESPNIESAAEAVLPPIFDGVSAVLGGRGLHVACF